MYFDLHKRHLQDRLLITSSVLLKAFSLAFILSVFYCYMHGVLIKHPSTSLLHSSAWSLSIWLPWIIAMPLLNLLHIHHNRYWVVLILTAIGLTGKITISVLLLPESNAGLVFFRYLPFEILMACLLAFTFTAKKSQQDSKPAATHQIQAHKIEQLFPVPINSVVYISAARNYVELFTAHNNYLVRMTLSDVASLLESHGFIRTHRSHLINSFMLSHIKKTSTRQARAVLFHNKQVPISQNHIKDIQKLAEQ